MKECKNKKCRNKFEPIRSNHQFCSKRCWNRHKYESEDGKPSILRRGDPKSNWLTKCKYDAKRRGIYFNLTKEDVQIPKYCPILGIELKFESRNENTGASPSIDRIDSSKGYTPDNVAVISAKANTIKGPGTLEELKKVVTWLESLQS